MKLIIIIIAIVSTSLLVLVALFNSPSLPFVHSYEIQVNHPETLAPITIEDCTCIGSPKLIRISPAVSECRGIEWCTDLRDNH